MDYFALHFLLFEKIIFLLSLYRSTQAVVCEANIKVGGQPYNVIQNVTHFLLPSGNSACRENFNKSTAGQPFSTPKDLYFQVEPVTGDDGVITKVWWSDGGHPCFNYIACSNDRLQMTSDEGTKFICRKCDPASKNIQYSSVSTGTFSAVFMYDDSSCSSITSFLSTSYKHYNTNLTSDYFCCKSDNLCIWKGLRCDNVSNCIDGSDETGCSSGLASTPASSQSSDPYMIIGAVILVFVILCICVIIAHFAIKTDRGANNFLLMCSCILALIGCAPVQLQYDDSDADILLQRYTGGGSSLNLPSPLKE